MNLKEHPDWHDVVAGNWRKTTAHLLAFQEPCITIREDELASIRQNRVLVGLDPHDLAAWAPDGSWFLAAILCPGDDVTPLTDWIERHGADPDRIHFYAHPNTDAFAVLEPWLEAGLPDPRVDEGIDSWRRLHKRFGNDLSIQILKDWS